MDTGEAKAGVTKLKTVAVRARTINFFIRLIDNQPSDIICQPVIFLGVFLHVCFVFVKGFGIINISLAIHIVI